LKRNYVKLRVEQLEGRDCPAPVTLPHNVVAGGYTWKVSNNTFATNAAAGRGLGITEASKTGGTLTDAYDGAFIFRINGTVFKDPSGTVDLSGTTLTSNLTTVGGLQTSIEYFFVPTTSVVRALVTLTNPGTTAVTAAVQWENNLGSDDNTTVDASSNGNTTLENTDRWFVSDNDPGDPALTFVRAGTGLIDSTPTFIKTPGQANPVGQRDRYFDLYNVFIPAGQTRRVLVFGQTSDTPAAALASAAVFNSPLAMLNAGYLAGLSDPVLDQVVNWRLPPVNVQLGFGSNQPVHEPLGVLGGQGRLAQLDLFHNGINDFVAGSTNGRLTFFLGTGQTFKFAPFGNGYRGPLSVAAGDFNRDGVQDLVVGAAGKGQVLVLNGLTLLPIGIFITTKGSDLRVATGDLNGDGQLDVVASVTRPGGTLVFAFDHNSPFAIRLFFPYGTRERRVVLVGTADLDHDGLDDILTLNRGALLLGFRSLDLRLKLLAFVNPNAPSGTLTTPLTF
jgi:FG-GAP-like repeat